MKTKQKRTQPAPEKTSEERWKEERAAIAATLILADLDDHERANLATCQKLYRRYTGCNSPFEDFFHSLITMVDVGLVPTPDDVLDKLEEFRQNFNDMKRDARVFMETYPEKPDKAA